MLDNMVCIHMQLGNSVMTEAEYQSDALTTKPLGQRQTSRTQAACSSIVWRPQPNSNWAIENSWNSAEASTQPTFISESIQTDMSSAVLRRE